MFIANLNLWFVNYFVKTPWWLKRIYPSRTWHIPTKEKVAYLTFDDGPHPLATPFVLDQLKQYNARATFFCIGKNVQTYPELYQRMNREGHRAGNHTQDHLNGFKTPDKVYLENISEAATRIRSNLFRPPYGRMKSSQARELKSYKIVMWDLLSGDFDEDMSREKCLNGLLNKTKPGSIIVFHESDKAWEKMCFALPRLLEHLSGSGYKMEALPV